MSKPDGGSAFPAFGRRFFNEETGDLHSTEHWSMGGMSLRDYFAAAALPAVLAAPTPPAWERGSVEWREQCAAEAYAIADAMLAQRDK